MEQVAAVWLLFELTESPALVGLYGVARAAAFLLVAPFAGTLADRRDQRRVLLVTQSLALVASLTLGLLVLSGLVTPLHVYAQTFAQGVIAAFDVTARQALYPRLVARRHLPQAVALNATAARTSGLVGPAFGGLLIVWLGNAAPFLVNAASYVALFVAVLAMRAPPPPVPAQRAPFRADLLAGFRAVLGSPLLVGVLRLEAVVALLSPNPTIVAALAREMGLAADGLGVLLAALALGALAGNAVLIVATTPHRTGLAMLAGGGLSAATLPLLALAGAPPAAAAVLFAAGAAEAIIGVTRNTTLHLATAGAMRGRTLAALVTVRRGLHPLSDTVSGALADAAGARAALVVMGLAMGAAVGATAVRNERLREFVTPSTPVEPETTVIEA